MKISELIEKLKEFDPESVVVTEGCDCHGIANGVEILNYSKDDGIKRILITRE